MKRDELLLYYERELRFIRRMASEFADKYPEVASRLQLQRATDELAAMTETALATSGPVTFAVPPTVLAALTDAAPDVVESFRSALTDADLLIALPDVAFDPSSKRLATGAEDRTIRLWNPAPVTRAQRPARLRVESSMRRGLLGRGLGRGKIPAALAVFTMSSTPLPEPDPAALAHSGRLSALIARRIEAAGGWIDFGEFMELALYAPGLGYYRSGTRKFGAGGDFVTAPELSPLFARCLARPVGEALAAVEGDTILEFGAGSGALAVDLYTALEDAGRAPARYRVLELGGELRERQQALVRRRLPHAADRFEWLDRLPEKPLRGVVLANEVLDALPVTRFRIGADGDAAALGVADGPGGLHAAPGPLHPSAVALLAELAAAGVSLPPGYASECCPSLRGWLAAIAGVLDRGLVLLVDYGLTRREYYHPDRAGGTLLAHYRHRAHADVLRWPGLQDLGAWVDFSAAAQAGRDAGLQVAGFGTQAHLLMANGLDAEMATLAAGDATARSRAALAAARRLVMPGEMGERFKVLALARGLAEAARPALLRDLSDRL